MSSFLRRGQVLVMLSGKRGSGKDYVAEVLRTSLRPPSSVELFRIGSVTKKMYAAANPDVDFKRLMDDREYKNSHRQQLTNFYTEKRGEDELFELKALQGDLQRCECNTLCVVDLRMKYEVEYFEQNVPQESLLHVRLKSGASARMRRGTAEDTNDPSLHDPTEIDLDDVIPDVEFVNDGDGPKSIMDTLVPIVEGLHKGHHPRSSSNVFRFLETSLQHTDEYEHDVLGKTFILSPDVLSPKYSRSAIFMVEHWNKALFHGATVLDMGTGCGVLAVFAADHGAKRVVALDVSEAAVNLARRNVAKLGFADVIDVQRSDGFSALSGKQEGAFDVLVFNPPFFDHAADPNSPLTLAVFDQGQAFFKRVMAEAPKYLKHDGKVVLVVGSAGLSGATVGTMEAKLHEIIDPLYNIIDEMAEVQGHKRTVITLQVKVK